MPTDCDLVLPCRDEAAALPWVVARVPPGFRALVVDNGSRDGTTEVARSLGATVVEESLPGYGSAVGAGVRAATAEFVAGRRRLAGPRAAASAAGGGALARLDDGGRPPTARLLRGLASTFNDPAGVAPNGTLPLVRLVSLSLLDLTVQRNTGTVMLSLRCGGARVTRSTAGGSAWRRDHQRAPASAQRKGAHDHRDDAPPRYRHIRGLGMTG